MHVADLTDNGYLASADWATFNGKGSGTVTSVTGTAPVVSSGGSTPAISMHVADLTDNGYLASADWATFNGKRPLLSAATVAGYLASADWATPASAAALGGA